MQPVQKVFSVEEIKAMRVEADALLQKIDIFNGGSREIAEIKDFNIRLYSMGMYEAVSSIISVKMWLGKLLEATGTPFPAELADKAISATGLGNTEPATSSDRAIPSSQPADEPLNQNNVL